MSARSATPVTDQAKAQEFFTKCHENKETVTVIYDADGSMKSTIGPVKPTNQYHFNWEAIDSKTGTSILFSLEEVTTFFPNQNVVALD